MKFIFLIVFFSMHFLNAEDSNELHSWTDLNGRTLQAKFIEADSTTVTGSGTLFDIQMNDGNVFEQIVGAVPKENIQLALDRVLDQ